MSPRNIPLGRMFYGINSFYFKFNTRKGPARDEAYEYSVLAITAQSPELTHPINVLNFGSHQEFIDLQFMIIHTGSRSIKAVINSVHIVSKSLEET